MNKKPKYKKGEVKMRKKLNIILVIFLIIIFILSGCKGEEKVSNSQATVKIGGQIQAPKDGNVSSLSDDSEFVGIVKDFYTGEILIDSVEVEKNRYSIQIESSKNIIIIFSRNSDNMYLATYIPETGEKLKSGVSDVNAESTIVSLILKDVKTDKVKSLIQDDILSLREKAKEIVKDKNSEKFNNMINNQNLDSETESPFTKNAQEELEELEKYYAEILEQQLISGFVYDKNGKPIENIKIVDSNNDLLATSNYRGKWQFRVASNTKRQLLISPVNKDYYEPTYYYPVEYTFQDSEKYLIETDKLPADAQFNFYANEFNPNYYNLQDKLRANKKYETEVSYLYDVVKKPVYWISATQLGEPNNTKSELMALQSEPKELKKEIDNIYEALMFLGSIPEQELKDNEVTYVRSYPEDDWEFSIDQPTELAIKESKIYSCRPAANTVDYLLSDDYDEVGVVFMRSVDDGHAINYIREGNTFYFIDSQNAFRNGGGFAHDDGIVRNNHYHHSYIIKTKYPEAFIQFFANSWQEMDHTFFALYDFETNPVHIGSKGGSGVFGFPIANDGSDVKVYKDEKNNGEYGFIEAPSNPSTKASVVKKYSDYDSFKLFFDENNNVKNEAPEEIIIPMD